MHPGLDKYQSASQLVEVNVVIKRKNAGHAHVAKEGNGVAEDKDKNKDRVKEKCSSTCSR